MGTNSQKLPETLSYIPVWRATWLRDSFARRMGATISEIYMNSYGGKEKTIPLRSTGERRIISIEEHDAIIAKSDQNRLEYTARKAFVAKRAIRSRTIVGRILNELS